MANPRSYSTVSSAVTPFREPEFTDEFIKKVREDLVEAMARSVDEWFMRGGMTQEEGIQRIESSRAWRYRWLVAQ